MKYYYRGSKSMMNFWDSNKCYCPLCNSRNRDITRTTIKEKVKKEINKILNEVEKSRNTHQY